MKDRSVFLRRRLVFIIVAFFLINIVGALVFIELEKPDRQLSFLQSFYFMVMTSTTIGYGDLVPENPRSKMFITFYSLLSVSVFFTGVAFLIA